MIPGEVRAGDEPVDLNAALESRSVVVVNDGDRPIQIGSHLHLPDANPALTFDRDAAQGFSSGCSLRHLGALRARRQPHRRPLRHARHRGGLPQCRPCGPVRLSDEPADRDETRGGDQS